MSKTKNTKSDDIVSSVISFFNDFHPTGCIEPVKSIIKEEVKFNPSFIAEWAKE